MRTTRRGGGPDKDAGQYQPYHPPPHNFGHTLHHRRSRRKSILLSFVVFCEFYVRVFLLCAWLDIENIL